MPTFLCIEKNITIKDRMWKTWKDVCTLPVVIVTIKKHRCQYTNKETWSNYHWDNYPLGLKWNVFCNYKQSYDIQQWQKFNTISWAIKGSGTKTEILQSGKLTTYLINKKTITNKKYVRHEPMTTTVQKHTA